MMHSPRASGSTILLSLLLGCGASPDPRADPGQEAGVVGGGRPDAEASVQDAASFPDGLPRDTGPLPPDPCIEAGTCPPGVWTNVTPAGMSPAVLRPTPNAFGPGSIVGDPARPGDLYVGGSAAGLW